MRVDGIAYKKIKCLHGNTEINLPILFSFEILEKENNTIKASGFLPPNVSNILLGKEFFIYEEEKKEKKLQRAKIKNVSNGIVYIELLDDEKIVEKRLFERLAVCIEEKFKVLEFDTPAFILDMSSNGIKLFLEKKVDVQPNQILTLQHEGKIISIKVLRVEESQKGVILGCKIESANFHLLSFLMKSYIKQVKKILLKSS